jgi:hypothetical protein
MPCTEDFAPTFYQSAPGVVVSGDSTAGSAVSAGIGAL